MSGAWYTGVTKDLEKRFRQHQEGTGAKYMRMDKPKRIVAAALCDSRSQALTRESALKKRDRGGKRDWITQNSYRGSQPPRK